MKYNDPLFYRPIERKETSMLFKKKREVSKVQEPKVPNRVLEEMNPQAMVTVLLWRDGDVVRTLGPFENQLDALTYIHRWKIDHDGTLVTIRPHFPASLEMKGKLREERAVFDK